MAVVIVADVGSATANSFITLAEAQSYMDARLNASAWESATSDTQNRALVEATRELSARVWLGERVTSTQALSWPRAFVLNPDATFGAGAIYFDYASIPQRVKDATAELAFQFVNAGSTDIAALDSTTNIQRKTVDVLVTEYVEPWARAKGLARFPSVMRFIAPLLASVSSSVRVLKG